jgi:hypothetical protein
MLRCSGLDSAGGRPPAAARGKGCSLCTVCSVSLRTGVVVCALSALCALSLRTGGLKAPEAAFGRDVLKGAFPQALEALQAAETLWFEGYGLSQAAEKPIFLKGTA